MHRWRWAHLMPLSGSGKSGMPAPKRVMVLDYRLLEVMGPVEAAQVLERAEPALLTALGDGHKSDPKLRIAAAEMAAAATAISPVNWRRCIAPRRLTARADPLFRRANLFRSIEGETSPPRKLAAARALLDEARRTSLYLQIAVMVADGARCGAAGADQGPGAEAAIESAIAGQSIGRAQRGSRPIRGSGIGKRWLILSIRPCGADRARIV